MSQTRPIEQSTSVHIDATPSAVWDYVSDLAKTPSWRTTVTSIDPPEDLRVGEQFTGTTRLLGRTWNWTLELTDIEVGRTLAYVVVAGVAKPYVSYQIDADPAGTRFTMTGGIEKFGFAGRLLRPFAVPALRRETVAHLANLKRILESAER